MQISNVLHANFKINHITLFKRGKKCFVYLTVLKVEGLKSQAHMLVRPLLSLAASPHGRGKRTSIYR